MKMQQFRKLLDRDQHCLHCGRDDDTLIPHHRLNRGMGGRRSLDSASNIIVMCSQFNGDMEALEGASVTAQRYGWKLRTGQDPLTTPVFDAWLGEWFDLDNEGKRKPRQAKS